jgi:hypothetical protein
MEPNEPLKTTLVQEAEAEVAKLLKRVQDLKAGDLKGVEQEVLAGMFALGRTTLERLIQAQPETVEAPARRQGACGHAQRLVGQRPKQVLTLLGTITIRRASYQCVNPAEEQDEKRPCTHGEAPADAQWGIEERRTSAGVQQAVSYLGASLTLEETAAAFSRLFPLQMSARQALYLMQPVGEALAAAEQAQVNALWEEAAQKRTTPSSPSSPSGEALDRLSIQLDGVWARRRRGSVPMEQDEQKRPGDVYREMKVGAVFPAQRGRERSELAPGAWVDSPVEGSLSMCGMPRSMSGRSLRPSLAAPHPKGSLGPHRAAPGSCKERVRPSCKPSPPCRRLRLPRDRPRACQSRPWATLPPMHSACAIRSSGRKVCRLAVASPRPLVKPSSALGPSARACAGPLRASMRFYRCAPPSSMAPLMPSGRVALMPLLDCLHLFPTPYLQDKVARFCQQA